MKDKTSTALDLVVDFYHRHFLPSGENYSLPPEEKWELFWRLLDREFKAADGETASDGPWCPVDYELDEMFVEMRLNPDVFAALPRSERVSVLYFYLTAKFVTAGIDPGSPCYKLGKTYWPFIVMVEEWRILRTAVERLASGDEAWEASIQVWQQLKPALYWKNSEERRRIAKRERTDRTGGRKSAATKRNRRDLAIKLFDPKREAYLPAWKDNKSYRAKEILRRAREAEALGKFEGADKLPKVDSLRKCLPD